MTEQTPTDYSPSQLPTPRTVDWAAACNDSTSTDLRSCEKSRKDDAADSDRSTDDSVRGGETDATMTNDTEMKEITKEVTPESRTSGRRSDRKNYKAMLKGNTKNTPPRERLFAEKRAEKDRINLQTLKAKLALKTKEMSKLEENHRTIYQTAQTKIAELRKHIEEKDKVELQQKTTIEKQQKDAEAMKLEIFRLQALNTVPCSTAPSQN